MKNFKSGNYHTNDQGKLTEYKSFLPEAINKSFIVQDQSTLTMLEEATRLLGEINAYAKLIPDVDYFIQMHVKSEAVSSSRIEGTRTGIDEAILPEEEISPERIDDWHEVNNYITAMNWAVTELQKLPVSVRFLKETHKILLAGVRGKHKLPGQVRTSQNWIGGPSIRTAHFVPPKHEEINDLLSDWEKFWHNNSLHIPVLIKIAIMHYQFETIHPFLDGNGRLGRLFITLQLIERHFLNKPILYISSYFEEFRQLYYESLDKVRSDNKLEEWIKFFLEGVIKTSTQGREKFENIILLRHQYEQKIDTLGRKVPRAKKLLLHLFSQPIVTVNDVGEVLGIQFKAANNLVSNLVELGILEEKTGFSRNRLFEMKDYILLFKN
ncbi:MAG: Fic family protein [Patescibacteria group bacterium]|nr:Fic family protein [Patescibacteria group bacterium]